MGTNEKNTFISGVIDARMKLLMSIRDFQKDFESNAKEIEKATQDLISIYERGVGFLNTQGNPDFQKEWDDNLNEVRVHANQMNHQLQMTAVQMKERKGKEDFSANWKEYETHRNYFQESALKFEKTGIKALPEENHIEWEDNYALYQKEVESRIKTRSEFDKFIIDFVSKYDKDELTKISEIVQENATHEIDWSNPEEYRNQYIKAISQFQREFKPQNLWDSLLELLAGGVHPSPSERVMLEKWADGEQKTREDM